MTKATNKREILVVANPGELSHRTAQEFVRLAGEVIGVKGLFTVALSGGSTPRGLYMTLASDRYKNLVPWSKVYVFWGDERCVPPNHHDSNYHLAREALLDKVPIPKENVYRMPAEQVDHSRAAAEYERTIK